MAGLLSELGRRAVDRWFPSLAPPGLVYVSLAAVGLLPGHRHWADTELLTSRLTGLTDPATQADSPHTVLLLLVVLPPLSAPRWWPGPWAGPWSPCCRAPGPGRWAACPTR